jgi:3-oxoacid CoA-transferase subunit B
VTPEGLLLKEHAPGTTIEAVQRVTDPTLKVDPHLRVFQV